jgi:transposase
MRMGSMLLKALGVERAVVEGVDWLTDEWTFPEENQLVVRVRPRKGERNWCPHCNRRCPGYDTGHGERRWRAPDFGLLRVFLVADTPRVTCREHGVVVARVPWARHGSGFTQAFEDIVGWMAVRTDKSTLAQLMRVAWRTVGAIVERVVDSVRGTFDPFANLTRLGIDEVSYRKGQRYLTVVVDHATGRLLWAAPKADKATLAQFFDLLGPERCARIALVSADGAPWIHTVVKERCPQATLCMDPFHVVQWATKALTEVRLAVWNELRKSGQQEQARAMKHSRWALQKNPENLSGPQQQCLASIQRTNRPLYRAYLLKEQLREIFRTGGHAAWALLDQWIKWASRSRLAPFVKVARSILEYRVSIESALQHGLSNARIEATNNQLRLLTRLAYGFHSAGALIALAMLKLGGYCPALPGRI